MGMDSTSENGSPAGPADLAQQVLGPRAYRNTEKMFHLGDPVWQSAADHGLIGLNVDMVGDQLAVPDGEHQFINMCSCSYLGLNRHPAVIEGAVEMMRRVGNTGLSMSTTRIRPAILTRLEEELGELFGANTLVSLSCSVLAAGILPLVASGHLAEGGPRVMVFDRNSHFCLAYAKPVCADESLVLTCDHNDLNQLEDICRKYPRVAYVADGAYSMGGITALDGLRDLQERYGLFLFLDDSHSLSVIGDHGEGIVRSRIGLNPLTVIISSLHKGFGTKGGVVMFGNPAHRDLLLRHAGALGWSQNVGPADIGAALASAAIHRSPELAARQQALRDNIAFFDQQLRTPFAGTESAVRLVRTGETERAIELSAGLYTRGYYSSAVFFPIVARGKAGIRIMMRADLTPAQITRFADNVKELTKT